MKFFIMILSLFLCACFNESSDKGTINSSNGIGGSTARFIIQNDHLITVEGNDIKVFSLSNPTQPELTNAYFTQNNWILETIYPYQTDKIMLGSNQGAIIMDHSTPGSLKQLSFAEHFKSCDPVIAHKNYMYVTLRNGNDCNLVANINGVNQLLIYDIQDITQPILKKTIELNQPFGLGIKENILFVCYVDGIYKFDITDPINPIQIGDYSQQCDDIIPISPMLLTGKEGVYLVQDSDSGISELAIIRKGD